MATSALIPVGEYLSTTYQPDRDYIEGEVKERNLGEQPHAHVQAILARIFGNHQADWNVRVLTEQRVQISPTRFRIPDLCLLNRHDPKDRIITWPPLLCVEVLSEEDRMSDMQTRVDDHVFFGVQDTWIIDPWKRVGYHASENGFVRPEDGILRIAGTAIAISLADLFRELDES